MAITPKLVYDLFFQRIKQSIKYWANYGDVCRVQVSHRALLLLSNDIDWFSNHEGSRYWLT